MRLLLLIFTPPTCCSFPADYFDVVVIVGALSVGQVPVSVVRELCKSTKPGKMKSVPLKSVFLNNLTTLCFALFSPGGYICMTTRSNCDNNEYKSDLERELKQMEQEGLWTCVEVTEVEEWEKAVSEREHGYIPGAVYLYQKL